MFLHYPIGRTSFSPARHIAVVEDGAGVVFSGRERYCCATRTEAAGERGCGFDRTFLHYPIGRRIPSPARHSTVVEDGAGVGFPEESATAVRPVPRLLVECGCVFVRPSSITQLSVKPYPQHDTEPLSRMAQVWDPPEERATAVRPAPRLLVRVGVVLSDVPPLPN